MDYISPHQYLRELKELLLKEKQKINEQKNHIAKLQEYETATLYREIEKKLTNFLDDLEFKNPINTQAMTNNLTETETLKEEYKAVADEVKNFVTENDTILSAIPNYRGVQILYSGLHYKPKFMFIGINPGAGYFNNNGKNVENYEAQEGLEYLEETYKLGEETKELFELANCSSDLETAVKTNWVYLSTHNTSDLNHLLTTLLYDHQTNLYTIADDWTRRLIEAVQPSIIICEGKQAFGRVTWNVLKYPHTPFEEFGHLQTANNTHVIGYERNKFGGIVNKEAVAAKINEVACDNSLGWKALNN